MGLNQVRASKSLKGLLSGTFDPSVTALEATRGSLYYKTSAPTGLFQKQDDGLSLNWTSVGGGGGGGNQILVPTTGIVAGDTGKLAMLSILSKTAEVYSWEATPTVPFMHFFGSPQPLAGDVANFSDFPSGVNENFTEGVDYTLGGSVAATIASLVAAMNARAPFSALFTATAIGQHIRVERVLVGPMNSSMTSTSNWLNDITQTNSQNTTLAGLWSSPLGIIRGVSGADAIIEPLSFVNEVIAGEQILAGSKLIPGNGDGRVYNKPFTINSNAEFFYSLTRQDTAGSPVLITSLFNTYLGLINLNSIIP